jgi:hypothetical protein
VSVAGAQRKWHWPRQPPLVAPTRTCRAQWAAAIEVEVGGGDCGLKWNLKIMIFRLEISGCRGVCHWQTNLELVLGDLLLPTHHHEEIAGNFEFLRCCTRVNSNKPLGFRLSRAARTVA